MSVCHYGDCRETLKTLPDQSVQCCITSPPYFGLRDYGHADQIGLEASPEEYVAELVAVFREVRRVLRDDGTLWLNIGDSYASDTKGSGGNGKGSKLVGTPASSNGQHFKPRKIRHGLKPKDLIGIPWRVAFALQADGWYLRQDIIWAKPNPMPESVTDRCTKAHEYLFLLSKSPRYFYDAKAIADPAVCGWNGSEFHTGKSAVHQLGRSQKIRPSKTKGSFNGKTEAMAGTGQNAFRAVTESRNRRSVWTIGTQPFSGAHFAVMPPELVKPCVLAGCPVGGVVLDPFFGSGTVGMVAESMGRQWIGCELNEQYRTLIEQRTAQMGLVLKGGTA